MSEVKVNKLSPRSGTTVTLGDSGDTITIPSGVTFDASSGGLAGTLTTAAQPNITSVGTLTSFTSTGIDDNATSTAITIDSSENVLIGTTDTSHIGYTKTLNITSSNNTAIALQGGTSGVNAIFFGDGTGNPDFKRGVLYYYHSDNSMRFRTNDAERMRIDSSGNLLVANTTGSSSDTGHILAPTGLAFHTRDDGIPFVARRNTSDGDIALFKKDETTVGSIGNKGANIFMTNNSSNNTGFKINPDAITPSTSTGTDRDNAIDLGASGAAYKDLYLGGGVYLGGTGTANKLDDYEEGTWTPTWTNATASQATYTKIGRVVYASGIFTAGGSATTGTCGGLPYASNFDGSDGGGSGYHTQDTVTWSVLKISSTQFRFYTGSTQKQLNANEQTRFFLTYMV